MKNKRFLLISLILCLAVVSSSCVKKPDANAIKENSVTATLPINEEKIKEEPKVEVKEEAPKEELTKVEVKEEVKKVEPKKEETKKVAPKVTEKKSTPTPTSKSVEQPNQVTQQPATTTPTTPVPQTPIVKDAFQLAMEGAAPNNGRYKVTFDKTSGPVPAGLIYFIENINVEKEKDSNICGYVVSDNKLLATNNPFYGFQDNNKFKGFLSIPASDNIPSAVDCYVIIPSKEDGKTYFEKTTYTITK